LNYIYIIPSRRNIDDREESDFCTFYSSFSPVQPPKVAAEEEEGIIRRLMKGLKGWKE